MLFRFLILFACLSAHAATYYVANSGDNGDTGLVGHPWQTLAKVNGETFSPGDSILLNRGDSWNEQLIVPSSGSAGSPITIGAYGTGAIPVINGTGLGTTSLINLGSKSYVTLDSLMLLSLPSTDINSGAVASVGGSNFVIQNCTVLSNSCEGLALLSVSSVTVSNCIIGTNAISAVDWRAVDDVVRSNLTVVGCTINSNLFWAVNVQGRSAAHCILATITGNTLNNNAVGVYPAYADQIQIDHNTILQTAGSSDCDGIGLEAASSCVIENNNIGSVITSGHPGIQLFGSGATGYCTNNLVRYNYIHDCSGDGILLNSFGGTGYVSYNQIYYNVICRNSRGVRDYYGNTGNALYNNVIASNAVAGIGFDATVTPGMSIKNNLVLDNGTGLDATAATTLTHSNNCWYQSGGGTLVYYNGSTYNAASLLTWEATAVAAAPQISAALVPMAGSPLINAGVSVGLTRDYANRPIVGLPDIGANEWQPPNNAFHSVVARNLRINSATP